ncbi:MAG: MATE family efflux transporter [Ruminococcaceae bacterium]|nr:MATE family efflux transporter [Oscillospiraceae bacterium]
MSYNKKTDLTVGNPGTVLLKFAVPLLISTLFQQMYTIADSVIVGRFSDNGADAIAALGSSYPITMVFMSVALGMCTGAGVVIAHHYGAKLISKMKTAVSTALISALAISIIFTVIGFLIGEPLLNILGTKEAIFDDSLLYLQIYVLGMVFLFNYNICNGIFTAMGNAVIPLVFLIISSVSNIILDYVFVAMNPAEGVAGVAWATFICQGICSIAAFIVLMIKMQKTKCEEKYQKFSFPALKDIWRLALPSILQQSFVSVGNLFVQWAVNQFTVAVVAGYASAIKLNNFAVTGLVTMSNGMSSFTAQNIGAKKPDRVKQGFKSCLTIMSVAAVTFTLIYVIFSKQLIGFFLPPNTADSAAAIDAGKMFLLIVSPFFIIAALKLTCDGVLKGGGDMKSFMVDTFTDLIIRVVLAIALSSPFVLNSEIGIWISWPIGWTTAAIMAFCFYRKEKWLDSLRL